MKEYHILLSINDKTGEYTKFAGTTLVSIFENTRNKIHVHIFHDESLLNDAQITATSYADRVEFHTLYGDVTLPRFRIRKRIWMPKCDISLQNKGNSENPTISEDSRITVTYHTGKAGILADFGHLKIMGD